MTPTVLLAVPIVAALMLATWLWRRRQQRRMRLLAGILDLADALETDLRQCRRLLRELPLQPAGARALEPLLDEALRDLLAHRLWLGRHAGNADLAALRAARDALLATQARLSPQAGRLAAARDELQHARAALLATGPADGR